MARFIDSDKLICQVQNNDKYGTIIKQVFISLLQNSETEDVAPVVHAHWIIGGTHEYDERVQNIMHCSNCKALFRYHGRKQNVNYCYKCGAKMDEE